MESKISVQFLGAAQTVTGSKYLIKALDKSILVDCGLFQGPKKLRELNRQPLPINIKEVDVVLLTHGHLDHCGYLPRFVKDGFNGRIMATEPSIEVAKIILEDSAKIQEEDAERANKEKFTRHTPAMPLYDTKDVKKVLPLFSAQPLNKWIDLFENISFLFRYDGHIIGATFIELKIGDKLFVFSGDIGREKDLLMFPPNKPDAADVLFIEATYGNRIHPENAEENLTKVVHEAVQKNGTIIIPSFAVERTQLLMYLLWKLKIEKTIPDIPIYMDSPMGSHVLDVFKTTDDWDRLTSEEWNAMIKDITIIQTIQDTWKLAKQKHAKIVIAGSGMASGGRVLTYFMNYLGDPNATILLVGYQAEETRGRKLLEGATELKLYGKYYPVKAKVVNIEGLSAHADQRELINWLSNIKKQPEYIFITHSEIEGAEGLKKKMMEVYGWEGMVPELFEVVELF